MQNAHGRMHLRVAFCVLRFAFCIVMADLDHSGPELARDAHGHAVIDCGPCGFAHLWPKPTPDDLARYYRESFYETHSPPDWADKEEAEEPYWQIEHRDRIAA